MSNRRIGLFIREILVAILLWGMTMTLAACPEKGEAPSVRDGADNDKPADHMGGMGGGMGMP